MLCEGSVPQDKKIKKRIILNILFEFNEDKFQEQQTEALKILTSGLVNDNFKEGGVVRKVNMEMIEE